jgi:hypothetical protein
MRTFVTGTTRIDVVAKTGQGALELDRLVPSRFEGSRTIAHEAFGKLVDRYPGKPLAEYAMAAQLIN